MPSEEEAKVFRWPHPILSVESTYVGEDGLPVDFGVARYASGRVQRDIELEGGAYDVGAEPPIGRS